MPTRNTRTGVLYAADVAPRARLTRMGVLYACDPLDTVSGRIDIVTSLSGVLTSVGAQPRITPAQRAALASATPKHWLNVSVKNALGIWQDLGSVGGADYIMGARIVDNLETTAVTAAITLRAGLGAASIAPMMTDAVANTDGRLIDVARQVRVQLAVTTGGAPTVDDVVTVFLGSISKVTSDTGDRITLQCRDKMAQILDASFDRTRTYGDGATALEAVLQQMLTDCLGSAAPTLIVRDSPDWAPPGGRYAITAKRGDALWPKMQEVLDQIGWLVRYKWNGPHVSELCLFAPDRNASTAKYTLAGHEVAAVREASLDLDGVRNSVQIVYYPAGSLTAAFFTATSDGSVADYGLRPLIIAESRSSQIDSGAKAARMGNAILPDVALPTFTHTVSTRQAFWPVESGDMLGIAANDVTHDADQLLAATSVTLSIEPGAPCTATIQMRGKPASKGKAWLKLAGTSEDATSGTGTPTTFTSATITNTGTSSTPGNLVVAWTLDGLPAGGYVGVTTSGASTIAYGEVAPATSPRVLSSAVYLDGIAPPSGKVQDRVNVTLTAYSSAGAVLATRSVLSPYFFGII